MLYLSPSIIVSFRRVVGRGVDYDGGTWFAIRFRCPGAEVGHLAAFGTEGAPVVAFPGAGLVTDRAGHDRAG